MFLARRFAFALCALVFAALPAACARRARPAREPGARPTTLRVAIAYEPSSLDPLVADVSNEVYVEEAIFDALLKIDASDRLIPDLAAAVPSRANGGISSDLRTITYHLRHGVVWQDGVPFTAADVAFTYRSLNSDRLASPMRSLYTQIASLEAPSPFTIVLHLRKPSASAIRQLFVGAGGFIVPEHVLGHISDIRRSAFGVHPVGTGPFAVRSWRRGDSIDLVANDRYFAGRPHIDNLRVLIVPAVTTRVALLRTGLLDVARLKRRGLPPSPTSGAVRVFESRSSNIYYLDLNTRRAPLNERAVRQALAYAVDRSGLTKPFDGLARPAYSLMPPGSYDVLERAAPCDGGRDRIANVLLERAGWVLRKDGMRTRAGRRLAVDIVFDPGPIMGGMALQLQQSWRKLGIQTTLRPLPYGLLYDTHGLVTTGRYEIDVDEMAIADPSDLMAIAARSSVPPTGFNYPHYVNARLDRWLQTADATGEAQTRARLYGKVDQDLCRDVPFIPMLWEKNLIAVNRRVQGFVPGPGDSDLWNVASWSLK